MKKEKLNEKNLSNSKKSSNDGLKLAAELFIADQKKKNEVIKVLTCRQGDEYVKLNDFYPGYGNPFSNNMRIKTAFAHTTTVGVIRKSHDGSYILQIACARRNPKDENNRRIGYFCALKRACDFSAQWQMDGKKMQTLSVGPLYDLSMAAKIFNRIAIIFNSDFSYEADIEVKSKSKKIKSIDLSASTDK